LLVPKLQLGNAVLEAPASRTQKDKKPEFFDRIFSFLRAASHG